jgi:hypothetical protein
MFLESDEPLPVEPTLSHCGPVSIHEDVEHLIRIAGRLFSVIEQQIRFIERSLTMTPEVYDGASGSTLLKEQLLRVAANLNASLEEIAGRLSQPSQRPF